MTGKDLFDMINDIDDKYIAEAVEESSGNVSPSSAKAPVTAVPAKRTKLIRFVLPGAAGLAAIALAVFGLWKAGIIGGKKDLVEEQASEYAVTQDITTIVTTTPPESTNATTMPTESPATTLPVTTDFHGNCLASVSIPEDKMIEIDGALIPTELELTITNEGESPLYIEEVFTLQKQGDDGEWADAAVFHNEMMPFEERCVAAGETSVISVGILTGHYTFWSGPARLVINVHFYEPDPDDFTKIAYETDFYMKAVDFEL